MPTQHEMFPKSPFDLRPTTGWVEPPLWVRRLVIWRTPAEIIRTVDLRRGLNVIWSPDGPSAEGSSAIGHGAGKSAFCWLLRYCLGEDQFAPEGERQRIQESFEEGFVGADISLEGRTYSVIRPLGGRRSGRSVCLEGVLPQQVPTDLPSHTALEELLGKIRTSIVGSAVILMPKSIGEENAWSATLAWMTRDQDCRFSSHLEWRDSHTQSHTRTGRSTEDRLMAIRASLGALSHEELAERANEDRLKRELRDAEAGIAAIENATSRLTKHIGPELGQRVFVADSGLPLNDARTYAQDRLSSALKLDPAAALSDLESTRLKRTAAAEKVRGLEKDLDRIEIQIGEKTELIRKYTSLLPVDRNRLVREQNPICPLCEVPIDKVKAEGCGISTETCDLQALQSRIDRLTQDRAGLQMEVDRLKSSLSGHKFSHAHAKQDLDNLDLLVSRLERALIDNSEGVRSAYRLVHDVDRATTLLNEKDDLERSIVSLREELTSSQDRLRAFREREAQVIARLSNRFDEVVGELVPGTVAGEVRLDGKTLHLSVQMGGVRRTAAISSLTVVAFDLACLCLAIEGNAKLPGFLLHDSPREADLGRSIYDRLFAFAKALEGYGEEPLFQYILTTTTSPPPEFREEPFCRLLLHGSPATERLFRTDL